MKVLVVTTVRFRFNGITSVILNYYRNMDKNDMHIDFVTPNEISDDYKKEFEENGSEYYYLNRKGNPLKYMLELKRILKKGKYDIVHIHGNSSMMLIDILPAVFAGVPVRAVHSHNTTCGHIWLHKLLNPFFRKCYTHGFACGQSAGKWLYGENDFIELKNGVDISRFSFDTSVRDEYRNKLGIGDKILVGHIGNFIEQKNHTFLIDAFEKLIKKDDRYVLLLISDGALMDQIKEKVRILGIEKNVIFLGKTPETAQYIQAMDLFVLPSLYEGLPVVLIEAQSSGLPCLVSENVSKESDLTGTIEFLPIDDYDKWSDKMREIVSGVSVSDRDSISKANNVKITDSGYNIRESAKSLKECYIKFIEGREK